MVLREAGPSALYRFKRQSGRESSQNTTVRRGKERREYDGRSGRKFPAPSLQNRSIGLEPCSRCNLATPAPSRPSQHLAQQCIGGLIKHALSATTLSPALTRPHAPHTPHSAQASDSGSRHFLRLAEGVCQGAPNNALTLAQNRTAALERRLGLAEHPRVRLLLVPVHKLLNR